MGLLLYVCEVQTLPGCPHPPTDRQIEEDRQVELVEPHVSLYLKQVIYFHTVKSVIYLGLGFSVKTLQVIPLIFIHSLVSFEVCFAYIIRD